MSRYLLLLLSALAVGQTAPPTVHMIGQGHIDPVWLWPWSEGRSVVHSTFRSALDRMNETPGFAFTASSAQFYEWVAENDPAMLREIRRRVEEGRWGLVGGWWVEPDVNIPSGEALVRQGLYGQRTLRSLLGRKAVTGFNPDSFGHAGTLPQILKLQGLSNYVFMRPGPSEKTLPNLFWWESPDGSRVLTFRIPFSYNDNASVRGRLDQIARERVPRLPLEMAYYGVGDHGGGATKANIASILTLQKEPGEPRILFSTPDRYFEELRRLGAGGLPVVKDDLQHHSVGCYTSEGEIKKANRSAELALVTAEKIAAVGAATWGAAYPKAELTSAWKRILLMQFHDSLAGTSLPEHYRTARHWYGSAEAVAEDALYRAAQKLAWQVATEDPESEYLVVFNPHAWEVTRHVEYDLDWDHTPARVEDEKGMPLPHQWGPATTAVDRQRLIARVTVPPMGYRQIRVRKAEAPAPAGGVKVEGNVLENEHLRATFGADGTIALFDKDAGREVFSNARAVVLDDPSDTWSHNVRSYGKEIGAFEDAAIDALEQGPLRAALRVRSSYGSSSLTTLWFLYAGSRQLEARVTLDWHERRKMLKFSFPVNTEAREAAYETAYGHIVRAANGDEEPGQRWIDLGGLAVINDAKYGYSVHGRDLGISIARSAPYAHHIPYVLKEHQEYACQDQGLQTFRMLLVPHRGTWQEARLPRLAEEFTAPAPVVYQGIHPGTRPAAGSWLSVDAPNVIVSAVKQAEDNQDVIVRCYETDGRPAEATLDLRFAGKKWTGRFRPSEIKTLRVSSTSITEVNVLE